MPEIVSLSQLALNFLRVLVFAYWVILHAFLSIIFIINFFNNKKFRNTIRVSNNLDPDQARHFVGPDLGSICLQGYQQMTLDKELSRVSSIPTFSAPPLSYFFLFTGFSCNLTFSCLLSISPPLSYFCSDNSCHSYFA